MKNIAKTTKTERSWFPLALRASALLASLLAAESGLAAPGACDAVGSLRVEHVTFDTAESHPAGAYTPTGGKQIADLPAFCRVHGAIASVPGSQVGFELWLPESNWNGKIEMFGNGGYSSNMNYASLGAQLKRGYATLATDTGHKGDDPSFALDHPEAIVDWGHRAVHESIQVAKKVVISYYGQAARHSYFWGCSTGGHQALMEAQRYPTDFDGIVAGDPGNNRTHLNAGFLWQFVKNHREAGLSTIIPPEKLAMITTAVINACHGKDGGLPSDNFLTDPEVCSFQPKDLKCTGDDQSNCLSGEQVAALSEMYRGAHDPKTDEQIYYGWPKGSENSGLFVKNLPGWSLYWADPAHPDRPARLNFWKIWAFQNADWDWRSFDFDADMKTVDDRLAPVINAMSSDLSAFQAAGGKLIQFHGLADPVVPPRESIDYYERVQTRKAGATPSRGDETASFYRLFLAPGLQHCEGGPGPNVLETQVALEKWVENSAPPDMIAATKFRDDKPSAGIEMARPVCPYPRQARYRGTGDVNEAANFACVEGRRYTPPLPASAYLR